MFFKFFYNVSPPNQHVLLSISLDLIISMIDLVSIKVEHPIYEIQALVAFGVPTLFIYPEGDNSNEDDNDVFDFHRF